MEEQPVSIAIVARMCCLKVRSLYHIYKEHLGSCRTDIENNIGCKEKIDAVNKNPGEVNEKPLYVFKAEHIGENMRIDDKAIGHDGFTVLSSSDTGKIAMPVETATADGVESVMEKIGGCLRKIKNLSMDMIPVYAPVFNSFVPRAVQVADLLHHSVAGQVEQRKGRDDASGF